MSNLEAVFTVPSSNSLLSALQQRYQFAHPDAFSYNYAFGDWNAAAQDAFSRAAQSWMNVANLSMTPTADYQAATYRLWVGDFGPTNSNGEAWVGSVPGLDDYSPFVFHALSFISFNTTNLAWNAVSLAPGGSAYTTMVHEIGHALGLSHPFSKASDPGSPFGHFPEATAWDGGSFDLGSQLHTVMAYVATNGVLGGDRPLGPMAFDIAAVQHMFGANTSYHTENNSYVLPERATGGGWLCIWDAGGQDEIRYDGSNSAVISLKEATLDASNSGGGVLSYAAGASAGFTIANGVKIETAIGGSGNDYLEGNQWDNSLIGNNGADTLVGGPGIDTLDGGSGIDTAVFSDDRSHYELQRVGDGTTNVMGHVDETSDGGDILRNVELIQFGPAVPDKSNVFTLFQLGLEDFANDNSTKKGLAVEQSIDGTIEQAEDHDWMFVDLTGGITYRAEVDGDSPQLHHGDRTLRFPLVTLHDPLTQQSIIGSTNYVNLSAASSTLTFTPSMTGRYFLDIQSHDISRSGTYTISISAIAGGEADVQIGTVGSDVFNVDNSDDTVVDSSGGDTDVANVTVDWSLTPGTQLEITAVSSSVGLTVVGNEFDNTLLGGIGDDSVYGGGGHDSLEGRAGNDTLVGNADIFAQEADTLDGGAGSDTIYGEFTDTIQGGDDFDILYAVNAFDWSIDVGATSIELLIADFGNDIITAAGQSVGVEVVASGGNDTVTGSTFHDRLWGGTGNDVIHGGDGDDMLFGDAGADQLFADVGNDVIYADSNDSAVDGGPGFDVEYVTTGSGVTIEMAAQGIEFVIDLAGGNNVITAAGMTEAANIYTGDGTDRITGSAFDDVLWGQGGADDIRGGPGNDVLVGGAGADILNSGSGADRIYANSGGGGDGAMDRMVFAPGWGHDAIYDFEHGIDKLDLTAASTSFAALSINSSGGSALVTLGSDQIVVAGLAGQLDANDFLF